MQQTWRWFGPRDKVGLSDIRQAGATGIVTALHHVATGAVWTPDEIALRQQQVTQFGDGRPTGLTWAVVESLPVSEAIKTQTGDWRGDIDRYKTSLEHLAAAGVPVICYNFMPVLDWTRTALDAPMSHGGTTMRFDLTDFAAFDIHILTRPGAADDFPADVVSAAAARHAAMDDAEKTALAQNITAGLPGAEEHWTLDSLRDRLADYAGLDEVAMQRHHVDFLSEVVPTAERLGLRLCCHPDDPPWPLLGLPRVVSTAAHYRQFLTAADSPACGVTLCTGSMGARHDNDLVAFAQEFGPRIHFVHLRNVTREADTVPCSFFEDEHLTGGTDMVAVLAMLLREEARRRAEGRDDWNLPLRPDHGQSILSDIGSGVQPGYPAVGRLKGLAELRGVIQALGPDGNGAPIPGV